MRGTARVSWDYDKGSGHTFRLPNSYYVPGRNVRQLSPQHWSCELSRLFLGKPKASSNTNYANTNVSNFTGTADAKPVSIDPESNTETFSSAPGYKKSNLFSSEAKIENYERQKKQEQARFLLTGYLLQGSITVRTSTNAGYLS